MKFRHSLRFRIVFAFCIFSVIVTALYGIFIYCAAFYGQDVIFENHLYREIKNFLAQYKENPNAALPSSAYIKAYIGKDQMSDSEKKMVKNLKEGFYERKRSDRIKNPQRKKNWQEYHLAIKKIPGSDEYLYLFYDIDVHNVEQDMMQALLAIIVLGFLIVVGIGIWLGMLLSRKMITPVTELANQVAKTDPENIPTDLSQKFVNDEIGLLARTFQKTMQRIKALIDREKQFTRDASHELRTPLTVIKGALELIEQVPEYQEKSIQRLVKRIERSVQEMALLIETFLWLGRERTKAESEETCHVFPEIQDAIEKHQTMVAEKSITFELIKNAEPTISIPAPVFRIIINNLLRNAIHYTDKGKISVVVQEDRINVSDTGPGISSDKLEKVMQPYVQGVESQGFGLGLSIVKRLSERFHMKFEIESQLDNGTNVCLIFSPSARSKAPLG